MNGAPFGWSVVRKIRHGSFEQKDLQSDCPLQGIDEVLVAILERDHPAAGIAFDIHDHEFLRAGQPAIAMLRHVVARRSDRLAEHDLSDICSDVAVRIDRLGDLRRTGGKLAVALRTVTVKLDMRKMHRQSFDSLDRRQRRIHIPGHAQVASMHMQRMRNAKVMNRLRQHFENLPGRNRVKRMLLVEIQAALIELERRYPAWIDYLDSDRLRGVDGPRDVVVDGALILLRGHHAQQKIVTAKHYISALVDDRRVTHLHVSLARIDRQHRRLEACRVTHFGITVSSCKRSGSAIAARRPGQLCARKQIPSMILWKHRARDVHLAATDMRVHVDGAGHHQPSPTIDLL